jgi:HD superfamily phosphohydrolase
MSIRDPIYGLIQITGIERLILKTLPMARTRWIKQMGLACLEFPGANHTRFEHSLGTMHVAEVLARNLFEGNQKNCRQNNIQEIRLAALLHDIGHTPFSHVVEEFFRRFPKYAPEGEQYEHEQYTTEIIANNQEIRDICESEDIDLGFVSELAVGKSKTFLDALISSCLDSDKIDYVVRDSYYCGLPYGNVDLLSLAEGIKISTDDNNENMKIVYESLSKNAAEGLLTSRFYLMTTVHIHERNCSANLLLFRAIAEAYDDVLAASANVLDPKAVKKLLSYDMHLKWVDHDLITFLKNPVEMFKLAVSDASDDELSECQIENRAFKMTSLSEKSRSAVFLDKVLSGRVPLLRFSYPLSYFSPGGRYDLFLIFRFAAGTKYFQELESSLKRLLGVPRSPRVYADITFPRTPEMNTLIATKEEEKYIYDDSLILRSLVLQSVTNLALSVYSPRILKTKVVQNDLETEIHNISQQIRLSRLKRKKRIGTDILLLIYYYLHELAKTSQEDEPRLFFKADTRFHAFTSYILHKGLPAEICPYPILGDIHNHFPNIDTDEEYEEFRDTGYPQFYSVALVQDLDLLSEMGLLYTRTATVPIFSTNEYKRRYERRISRMGRTYVARYIKGVYPFSEQIKKNIQSVMKSAYTPILEVAG